MMSRYHMQLLTRTRARLASANSVVSTSCALASTSKARLFSAAAREPSTEAAFPKFEGETRLFIDGKFHTSPHTLQTFNPGNGELLAEVSSAGAEQVDHAVASAHRAFYEGPWNKEMTGRQRQALMFKLADLVEAHSEELAVLEALDNGKTLNQTRVADAPACATILRYYAGWADKITGQHLPIGPGFLNYTKHEAVGVCGLIVPWNLPLIAVAAKLGPALATGNTAVLKTAEQTPLSALLVAQLVQKAGFPDGVVNIISGGPETGEALVRHPLVSKVSFTGSVEVGKRIQAMCSEDVKRVTLELGGNNPVIVCKDADLQKTAEYVHNGLFWNDGEACAAGSRIFVEESIAEEFTQMQVKLAEGRRVGNPFHLDSQQGSQVSEEQREKVERYIASAKAQGAELRTGGSRVGERGQYLAPTVFSGCKDEMDAFKDEVFGPVMTLSTFSEKDGLPAIAARANSTPYGLACGVFTQDVAKGNYLVNNIQAGLMFWNCYHVVDISAPFGGFKQSGMGREGGSYGLLPYLEIKNVVQATS